MRAAWALIVAAAIGNSVPAEVPKPPPKSPVAIDGLMAWYRVESLHANHRPGSTVSVWPDSSGNGRDLVDDENGRPASFEVLQVGELPTVRIDKDNTHTVTKPFDLEDHTIFLVYASARPRRGFVTSERKDRNVHGVLLRQEGKRDVLHLGAGTEPYGRDEELGEEFVVSVLGREDGTLHAFLDGANISSGKKIGGTLRVGRLFELAQTRYVGSDGGGLKISEMIFYDRYLADGERNAIARYLADKYGLPFLGDAGALLATAHRQSVNDASGRRVEWDDQRELRPPFEHDPAKDNSQVFCTQDGTRARLSVSMALFTESVGTQIRVLALKNNHDYLEGEGNSGRMAEVGVPYPVELTTTVSMDAGDYLEVLTVGAGEDGAVWLDPAETVLSLEVVP